MSKNEKFDGLDFKVIGIILVACLLMGSLIGSHLMIMDRLANVNQNISKLDTRLDEVSDDAQDASLNSIITRNWVTRKDKRDLALSELGMYILEVNPDLTEKDAFTIAEIVYDKSESYGFDYRVIAAQIAVESSFKVNAVGAAGEIGLMQVRPVTAKLISSNGEDFDRQRLYDPEVNIEIGLRYLDLNRSIAREYGKNSEVVTRYALTGYNRGHNLLERSLISNTDPSNGYEQKVLDLSKKLASIM